MTQDPVSYSNSDYIVLIIVCEIQVNADIIMHNFKLKPAKYVEVPDEPFPLAKRNSTTERNRFRSISFFQVCIDVSIQGNRQCPVHIKSLKSNFPLGSSTSVIVYWSQDSLLREINL